MLVREAKGFKGKPLFGVRDGPTHSCMNTNLPYRFVIEVRPPTHLCEYEPAVPPLRNVLAIKSLILKAREPYTKFVYIQSIVLHINRDISKRYQK